MTLVELFLTAVGLSMDAFAIAICKGLARGKWSVRDAVIVGLFFGGFQAGMPLLGYVFGIQFSELVRTWDHWIAFAMLAIIGVNMIRESRGDPDECNGTLAFRAMTVLAIATSIDALAVGISFAFLSVDIIPAVIFIGATTFALSFVGVRIGVTFGIKFKSKAEFAGGVILILIGVKILLEHLGVINF
jgi:putative Mn2+ efflux pump MntP